MTVRKKAFSKSKAKSAKNSLVQWVTRAVETLMLLGSIFWGIEANANPAAKVTPKQQAKSQVVRTELGSPSLKQLIPNSPIAERAFRAPANTPKIEKVSRFQAQSRVLFGDHLSPSFTHNPLYVPTGFAPVQF